ncbi:MAG: TFIIB-type zinc ribbon-containing protein [Candidatus Aenigmatarchaeota archaeon]
MEEKTSVLQCPECGNNNIIADFENGEYICRGCGLVIGKIYSMGPEWRAFDKEQKEKKTRGSPTNYMTPETFDTSFRYSDKDVRGKHLTKEKKEMFYRLRKLKIRKNLSLMVGLSEIDKIGYRLKLPKLTIETASSIFKEIIKRKLLQGKKIEAVASACLYFACRQTETPRTLKEISETSGFNKKYIGREYRFIVKKMGYKPPAPQNYFNYVSKITAALNFSLETERLTYKIFDAAKRTGLTKGKTPLSWVGASAYMASILCEKKITQNEIAKTIKLTPVTLRNRYKELSKELFYIIKL